MPRKKDESKMTQLGRVEALCRLGEKYKLKSLEVSENSFKMEFSDTLPTKRAHKLTKEQKDALIEEKDRQIMDELQLTDPETYEELLVKQSDLKELS